MLLFVLLTVVVSVVGLVDCGVEETTHGSDCPVMLPRTWERDQCSVMINCRLSDTGYNHTINQPFLCDNRTSVNWNYPPVNGTLNMKMWFEGKSEEYRVCYSGRYIIEEGPMGPTVEYYNAQPADGNGPILAVNHMGRDDNQDGNVVRKPCAVSSGGIVRFRLTSHFQGYLLPVRLDILPAGSQSTDLTEPVPKTDQCQARDGWQECEVQIINCPQETPGRVEFMKPSGCDSVTISWHYSWSSYLEINTWVSADKQDFKLCLNQANQPGNLTYTPSGAASPVVVPHSYELRSSPYTCIDSQNGMLSYKLHVETTLYIAIYNVSYTVDEDVSGGNHVQTGSLNQMVSAAVALVYIYCRM